MNKQAGQVMADLKSTPPTPNENIKAGALTTDIYIYKILTKETLIRQYSLLD